MTDEQSSETERVACHYDSGPNAFYSRVSGHTITEVRIVPKGVIDAYEAACAEVQRLEEIIEASPLEPRFRGPSYVAAQPMPKHTAVYIGADGKLHPVLPL